MTYRFKPGRALPGEIRRVADDQIGRALDALDRSGEDVEEAVHDLRKRMKKLRGLVRLLRPGLGKSYNSENAEFRDIARQFSAIRDAQVLSETLESLAANTPGEESVEGMFVPLFEWAETRRRRVLKDRDIHSRFEDTRQRLEGARRRLDVWRLDEMPEAAMKAGLKKTYKRARKRYLEARDATDPELLHEWRKRVKYHWYHCRLLREAWPEMLSAQIDALDELNECLGDDHDIVVLTRTLRRDAPDTMPQPARQALMQLAMDRSLALRRRAFEVAPHVMVETESALARRIAGYWTATAAA